MRFRSLLIAMLLLIVFSGCSYATAPRKFGVGIKYGYTEDATFFRGTNASDKNKYIESDGKTQINNQGTTQIPVFLQFDEELLSNHSFTYWFIDLTRLIQKDHPPELKGNNYTNLVGNKIYEVPTVNTYTTEFTNFYPQYSSIIDNASNPSLSADYYVNKLTFGKTWGFFYPLSDRQRLGTIGVGIGLNYFEGNYQINICDPYLISSKVSAQVSPLGPFRKGFCKKKNELFSSRINHFSWEFNIPIKLYSYIGDTFELNFIEGNYFYSHPSHYLRNENSLEPVFYYWDATFISTVVYF